MVCPSPMTAVVSESITAPCGSARLPAIFVSLAKVQNDRQASNVCSRSYAASARRKQHGGYYPGAEVGRRASGCPPWTRVSRALLRASPEAANQGGCESEWVTQEMTYDGCEGHAGYLDSMRFLAQRQDLKSFPGSRLLGLRAARMSSIWRGWHAVITQ
jgi:hypothetical protein